MEGDVWLSRSFSHKIFWGCPIGALVLAILLLVGCQQQGTSLAESGADVFIYPQAESLSTDPFREFEWKPVPGATGYFLVVGTGIGQADVCSAGELSPQTTAHKVRGLRPGPTYYARLYIDKSGSWNSVDISFRTVAPASTSVTPAQLYQTIEQLTAEVRGQTEGSTNTPTPGTLLAEEVAENNRSFANCVDFSATLMELLSVNKIISREVDVDVVPNGYDGHALVEYYDLFLKQWSAADPTFGLVYFDEVAGRGQPVSELNRDVAAESFSSIKPKFVTTYGDYFVRSYYLDPTILFLNVVDTGKTVAQSAVNSPEQFLVPDAGGNEGWHVFEFSASGSIVIEDPPGDFGWEIGNVDLAPVPNTLWTRSIALNGGWSVITPPPSGVQIQAFTFRRVVF